MSCAQFQESYFARVRLLFPVQNLWDKKFTTSSSASLRRAGCLLLSPCTPSTSVIPFMNSSWVNRCCEWREMMGLDTLITSWHLLVEILTVSIISLSVGIFWSSNNSSLAQLISVLTYIRKIFSLTLLCWSKEFWNDSINQFT